MGEEVESNLDKKELLSLLTKLRADMSLNTVLFLLITKVMLRCGERNLDESLRPDLVPLCSVLVRHAHIDTRYEQFTALSSDERRKLYKKAKKRAGLDIPIVESSDKAEVLTFTTSIAEDTAPWPEGCPELPYAQQKKTDVNDKQSYMKTRDIFS